MRYNSLRQELGKRQFWGPSIPHAWKADGLLSRGETCCPWLLLEGALEPLALHSSWSIGNGAAADGQLSGSKGKLWNQQSSSVYSVVECTGSRSCAEAPSQSRSRAWFSLSFERVRVVQQSWELRRYRQQQQRLAKARALLLFSWATTIALLSRLRRRRRWENQRKLGGSCRLKNWAKLVSEPRLFR